MTPAYAALIPEDVRANAAFNRARITEPKTFADLIAELGADHERHVAAVDGFAQEVREWSDRLDRVSAYRENGRG